MFSSYSRGDRTVYLLLSHPSKRLSVRSEIQVRFKFSSPPRMNKNHTDRAPSYFRNAHGDLKMEGRER
jgi:hypothetical protein